MGELPTPEKTGSMFKKISMILIFGPYPTIVKNNNCYWLINKILLFLSYLSVVILADSMQFEFLELSVKQAAEKSPLLMVAIFSPIQYLKTVVVYSYIVHQYLLLLLQYPCILAVINRMLSIYLCAILHYKAHQYNLHDYLMISFLPFSYYAEHMAHQQNCLGSSHLKILLKHSLTQKPTLKVEY